MGIIKMFAGGFRSTFLTRTRGKFHFDVGFRHGSASLNGFFYFYYIINIIAYEIIKTILENDLQRAHLRTACDSNIISIHPTA